MTLQSDPDRPMKFPALRAKWYKGYLIGGSLNMAGDHVEHAITYWVMWQLFESPFLAGLAVVSHWAPHLFGVFFGGLADRYDCRRITQIGVFMLVVASVGWAAFIATGTLQPWSCVVLLLIHGIAGAIWTPARQMLIYDIVGPKDLTSGVRLAATGNNLGTLAGPVIGTALLFTVGPVVGLLLNVVIYLPFIIYLFRLPFTGHAKNAMKARVALGLRETFSVLREIPRYPGILTVFILQGAVGLLIGSALMPLLPEFGNILGQAEGLGYTALIVAMSLGAVTAGIVLETIGGIHATPRLAIASTTLFAASLTVFAFSQNFVLSLVMLLLAGAGNLISMSTSQTVVQLDAPSDRRGRFIGAYSMTSMGLRVGSGLVVGVLGGIIGVASSIGVVSGALLACCAALFVVVTSWRRRNPAQPVADVEPVEADTTS